MLFLHGKVKMTKKNKGISDYCNFYLLKKFRQRIVEYIVSRNQ